MLHYLMTSYILVFTDMIIAIALILPISAAIIAFLLLPDINYIQEKAVKENNEKMRRKTVIALFKGSLLMDYYKIKRGI